MSARISGSDHGSSARARAPRLAVAGASIGLGLVTALSGVSGASGTSLRSISMSGFSGALGNGSSHSLYILSIEKGAKVHCKTGCTSIWPPFLVKTSVRSISLGGGVKGKIGFVARSRTMKQVTFNTFPIYVYSGDTGAKQSNGEGIVSDGGTWTLVHAGAKSAGATPFMQSSSPPPGW